MEVGNLSNRDDYHISVRASHMTLLSCGFYPQALLIQYSSKYTALNFCMSYLLLNE